MYTVYTYINHTHEFNIYMCISFTYIYVYIHIDYESINLLQLQFQLFGLLAGENISLQSPSHKLLNRKNTSIILGGLEVYGLYLNQNDLNTSGL